MTKWMMGGCGDMTLDQTREKARDGIPESQRHDVHYPASRLEISLRRKPPFATSEAQLAVDQVNSFMSLNDGWE